MNTKREPGHYRVKLKNDCGFDDYWTIGYYGSNCYWTLAGLTIQYTDDNFSEISETPISVEPPTIREIRQVETDLPAFKAGWDACNTHKDDDKENVAQLAFDYATWKRETKH